MLRGAVRAKDVLPLLVRAQEEGANAELQVNFLTFLSQKVDASPHLLSQKVVSKSGRISPPFVSKHGASPHLFCLKKCLLTACISRCSSVGASIIMKRWSQGLMVRSHGLKPRASHPPKERSMRVGSPPTSSPRLPIS